MNDATLLRIERNIAQCRILLSLAALLAVYSDPTKPIFAPENTAAFLTDPPALLVMLVHLAYSVAVLALVRVAGIPISRVVAASTWGDVLFGAAVTLATEAANSPFYVFFLFAVLAAGLRGTRHTAWTVTATSVTLYVGIILLARADGFGFYLTRAVFLGIMGYLVGSLGRQRRMLQFNLHGVTRSLHDGYAQTLAGVNLRLETCRQLLQRRQDDEAFVELSELQVGITREYDHLRAYVRSLEGLDTTSSAPAHVDDTTFQVGVQFEAPLPIVEHAFQVMLEGARNVSRHAQAESAVISATLNGDNVVIRIDDDGVGFPAGANAPWSIASRAAEVGGRVRIGAGTLSGGHVVVELPTA